ncbi:MAG: universal stress protein [Desulfurivibrionaceae bacterium]
MNLDKHFSAASFAEAGEFDTAREMMNNRWELNKKNPGVLNALDRMFSAITFAEANEHETARHFLDPAAPTIMAGQAVKEDSKIRVQKSQSRTLQDTAVATAFAEAGEHDTAQEILDASSRNQTILVLNKGTVFSEVLMKYAIEMAQRFNTGILALNMMEVPTGLTKEASEATIRNFEKRVNQHIKRFAEKAKAKGIELDHIIRMGDEDQILREINNTNPGIRYCLSEPGPETGVEDEDMDESSIPVLDLAYSQI